MFVFEPIANAAINVITRNLFREVLPSLPSFSPPFLLPFPSLSPPGSGSSNPPKTSLVCAYHVLGLSYDCDIARSPDGTFIGRNRWNIVTRDCNPGHLFQSRDFWIENANPGIPGLNPGEWVPDFELVKISSNSLVLVSWWVLESWSLCWSPVLTYYYVNNCKYLYLSSVLSYDTISPLFNVKLNLLIFIKIQDSNVFFGF